MVFKNVLVTGGASGIGLATARSLLKAGYRVAIADIGQESLSGAREALRQFGSNLHCLPLNVTDEGAVIAALDRLQGDFGPLQGLVNSAGIGREVPALETSLEQLRQLLEVNLVGSFLMCREVAKRMIPVGGGSIVNIASVSGIRGNVNRLGYGASKAAMIHMTKVLAVELAENGIRVNAVAPGPIETPLVQAMHSGQTRLEWTSKVPQRRYGKPAELAGITAFLLDDDLSSYITGQVFAVDGGFTAAGLMS